MYLGITVTPAEGYDVQFVRVNGQTTSTIINGIYCFLVEEKVQNVDVTFIEAEAEPKYATITYDAPANGTLNLTYIDFNQGGAAAPQTSIATGGQIDVTAGKMWLVFNVEPAEGYALDSITINGNPAVNYGVWLYELKVEGDYNCVVTFKLAE